MATTWIRSGRAFLACAAAVLLSSSAVGRDDPAVLLIGSSGATTDPAARRQEVASRPTLVAFIKEETGLDSKIDHQKDWRVQADRLARGELHLGVFEGYELPWAQERQPGLKALAVAINAHPNPVACLMVKGGGPVKEFGDLKGKSIYLPPEGPHHLRVFVEKQCGGAGKSAGFFAKITSQKTPEDALDDVVDGITAAAAVDHSALDAYKQRKPVRAKRLTELMRSGPFPPPTVVYHGTVLSEALRRRFLAGLLEAHKKERGRWALLSFRVTAFRRVPEDFARVLARSGKDYPAPPADPTK
jgi:ABC-type phosphate/phosphonate transport system substrate-binding protein